MAKHKKKLTEKANIDAILNRCQICHLGMSDGDEPYVIPLSFGYDGQTVYLHTGIKGKKLDVLRKNPKVCMEFSVIEKLIEADQACEWDMECQSVVGYGTAEIIDDNAQKAEALNVLMAHYSDREFSFPEEKLKITTVIKVQPTSFSGREVRFT